MAYVALAGRLVRHIQRGTCGIAQLSDQIVEAGRTAKPDVDRIRRRLAGLDCLHKDAHQVLHIDEVARLLAVAKYGDGLTRPSIAGT